MIFCLDLSQINVWFKITECLKVNVKSFQKATFVLSEAVVQGCSIKKMFFKISKNSQERTCTNRFEACQSLFFNKVAGLGLQLY